MKKDKYLQIFNYLKEFSKLRSNPVRDIEAQETQYPEKFWLDEIPDNELFENIIRPSFNKDNDYWLNIRKPKEPTHPEFARLPNDLEKWIEKPSLLNVEGEPKLMETLDHKGNTLSIDDFPELQKELQLYIEKRWLNDLIEYNEKQEEYRAKYKIYEKLNAAYKQLFRIFNKTHQFGEEYELVVGVGLLNFKENDDCPKIFRHILTQRVDIKFEYSKNDSQILVLPNLESAPQIETDSILDLSEQFDSKNVIAAEKSAQELIAAIEIDTIFNRNIHEVIGSFSQRFCPENDGDYIERLAKPTNIDQKPKIYFSPCLILRKRNTRSFTALFEKIIENIENGADDQDIPTINDLIGFQQNNAENSPVESTLGSTKFEPIYFPKEYNDEQIEIVEKANRNNKVLVQGPPGTGKSHTIANLICHLLANGKKVLITAYTKRALEVLKDKLPPEFQDLAVNLLSGDSSSIQDLQSSVNAINDELSRVNLNQNQAKIEELEIRLKKTRETITETSESLVLIQEKATRKQEFNEKYKGTLIEIAENLERDAELFEWYKDVFSNTKNDELLFQLTEFIQLHETYKQIDINAFEFEIPDPNKLLTSQHLKEYASLQNILASGSFPIDQNLKISCSDFEKLKHTLNDLQKYYNEVDKFQIDFTSNVIESFRIGRDHEWLQILEQSKSVLDRLEMHDLRMIDNDIEVSYSQGKNIKQLKKDAQTLLSYLKEGNPLTGIVFTIKKPFLPKKIKDRLYFIEEVHVNGSACETIEEFEIVLEDISFQQDFKELSEIWKKEVPKGNLLFKKFSFFRQMHDEVSDLINLIKDATALKSVIESISNLEIALFDKEDLKKSILKAEYSEINESISKYKEMVRQSKAYLNNVAFHPIKQDILVAFNKIDFHTYGELLINLEKLICNKEKYLNFKNLRRELFSILPSTVKSVEENTFLVHDVQKLKLAVFFRNAQHQLKKLMDENYENQLIQSLIGLEKKEKDLISKLASQKAWGKVVEDLGKNPDTQSHLIAWKQAIKSIPKNRASPNHRHFRNVANKEMEYCKKSIPCWIMPLYQVVEQFQPEPEIFDYIIIDEASQLGPDAIFLFYLAKKVIVVGDDKQTAPEYVGVKDELVKSLIHKHLKPSAKSEIPYADFYGIKHSFFDHCDRLTRGKRIVLQEHFRCMPEIIEFSNHNFYAPDGKCLYPLKQYSESRLDPLVTEFCPTGFTEGKYSRIINQPEAESIANKIAELVNDKQYMKYDAAKQKWEPKSFGVITLQGNQQASLIENLLLKKIGEKEFHKRKIICGNSASFQGDERDVIFLSLVTAHNHKRSALVKPEDERRFNVAASRAIEQIWLFHSVQLDDFGNSNDLRYKLLDHFKNYRTPDFRKRKLIPVPKIKTRGSQPDPFRSWFEVEVFNDMVSRGLSVISNYKVVEEKYEIDLVPVLSNGTKIAVECDGDKWHGPEQYLNDMMRQKVLERCGWQFFRVRGYEYYSNRKKALEPLWKLVDQNLVKNEVKNFNPLDEKDYEGSIPPNPTKHLDKLDKLKDEKQHKSSESKDSKIKDAYNNKSREPSLNVVDGLKQRLPEMFSSTSNKKEKSNIQLELDLIVKQDIKEKQALNENKAEEVPFESWDLSRAAKKVCTYNKLNTWESLYGYFKKHKRFTKLFYSSETINKELVSFCKLYEVNKNNSKVIEAQIIDSTQILKFEYLFNSLSYRSRNILKYHGLTSIGDITDYYVKHKSFIGLKGCGSATNIELIKYCKEILYLSGSRKKDLLESKKNEENPDNFEKALVSKIEDIEIVRYSLKSIAIFGNTKEIKEELKALQGRFNHNLTWNDKKYTGWIVRENKLEEVTAIIKKWKNNI